MSGALDTILSEIQGLRTDVREDQSKIWEAIDKERECTTNLKLENERRKAEVNEVKLKQKMTEEAFVRHVQNPEKHYQPYYNETIRQKLWRKKPEIVAGGGVGALVVGIITLALKIAGVIP